MSEKLEIKKQEQWNLKTHLSKSCDTEIFPHIIIREVTKSSHPDICSNEYTNGIVDLFSIEVVVH
jgi:hypothetical protein